MATLEQLAIVALARALDFDAEVPSTRQVHWRRLQLRQQQLFSIASRLNPDYYGVSASGVLDANAALNLDDLATTALVDQAVGIQRIEIDDAGTSGLTTGDDVNIVSVDDIDADLSPRVTLRDFIIRGVGSDLTNVTSLCVFYSRIPDLIQEALGTETVQLPEQYQELLVVDLLRDMISKTISMEATTKTAVLELLTGEESGLMDPYLKEVATFQHGQRHRFSEPVPSSTR